MLIAHLADLHLGYRAYHRLVAGGINARERDIAQAFRAALDRVIELQPQVLLIAGDVFHTVRPSNAAIADAFRQFMRLRKALPGMPVVMIAGNHDSPRSVETGSILRLFAEIPGVHVMDQAIGRVYFEDLDLSVTGMPHSTIAARELIPDPDPDAGINVLMLHAELTGPQAEPKLGFTSEFGGADLDADALRPERWDYIALGHHHVKTDFARNIWYAGAIERTSANIWKETEPKGFLTFDTEARLARFHELETRTVVDLPPFSARLPQNGTAEPAYLDAKDLDARIRALVDAIEGGLENKIVRLVIYDIPRDLFRELNHRALREYRSIALHFHLDARRPEARRAGLLPGDGRRRTLEQEVEWFITEHWRPTSSEIEKHRLLDLARLYLAESRELEPAAADEPESDG
ncbi:MAG TPA: DNA repair exonuclease [Longimicrobiales bacterium]|nr:DNA repair exonuclease [Longimicrobiales bacterium]